MRTYFVILILVQTLVNNISLSCSPLKTATVNTEEAIYQSDSIVLATVLGSRKNSNKVLFEVDEVIYGKEQKSHIELYGYIVSKSLGNKGTIPYKKGRRKETGLCNARDYERGSTYLLMLKDSELWSVFTPINEKITGKNDPWLMWVKGFLAGRKSIKP